MKVTAEEIERVLAAHHGWTTIYRGRTSGSKCGCGAPLKGVRPTSELHRAHVAAHILKLLSKEGEK